MQMRWVAVLLAGVVIGAVVASVTTWALLGAPPDRAEGADFFIDIMTLEAETDEDGCFAADYALEEGVVLGMVGAISNVSGDWHTMEAGGDLFNNFWWHDAATSGCIRDPSYAFRPARVLLFIGYPQ